MTVQPEEQVAALTVTGEELRRMGWTACTLTREQALSLVKGLCPGHVVRLEVYEVCDGVLILAGWRPRTRPAPRRPLRRGRVRRYPT